MPYAYLIVNPTAGAGKSARVWPQIKDLLRSSGLDFDYALTETGGHAIELAKCAAQRGYTLLVSVGGDGTISEVVNGMCEAHALNDVMLGIVSTGTGADYIRTMDIPRAYDEACRLFLKPKTRMVDLGIIDFINDISMEV